MKKSNVEHRASWGRRRFLKEVACAAVALGPLSSGLAYSQLGKDNDAAVDMSKVTAFIEAQLKAEEMPGALLVAARDGNVFYEQYWGTCCDGTRRDASFDSNTAHILASFSKVITATVVAMAQQEGQLDYDAPVSTYIPEFTGGGKETITLRQLLTHSAGIPSVGFGDVLTPEKWQVGLDKVCAAEVEWPPGSKTAYHGLSGAFVAAEALRRVSGMKPWDALCRERLFEPLGATSLTFDLPPAGTPVSLGPQPKELPAALDGAHFGLLGHPAGGCIGTPGDVLKVLQLFLNRGTWEGKELLKPDTVDEMLRVQYMDERLAAAKAGEKPTHEFWGLGWLTRGIRTTGWFGFGDQISEASFGHAGLDTVMGIADPETKLSLVFITTDSPKTPEQTTLMRNTVTNLVAKAIG